MGEDEAVRTTCSVILHRQGWQLQVTMRLTECLQEIQDMMSRDICYLQRIQEIKKGRKNDEEVMQYIAEYGHWHYSAERFGVGECG